MDHYPILEQGASSFPPNAGARKEEIVQLLIASESKREPLRFPAEDGGRSLTEMAKRDLETTLQLLTERALYITGATGAAIALREGKEMICCARAGESAPKLTARVEMSSGLAAESVRHQQILRCPDTSDDPRVNRESCQAKGILSAMVMPLLRQEEVVGVFELLSGQRNAFEERDVVVLERLGEMVQTAMDHAEAAHRAQSEIFLRGNSALGGENEADADSPTEISSALLSDAGISLEPEDAPIQPVERGKIGSCAACGFPISEGRTLCLDCEKSQAPHKQPAGNQESEEPAFLSDLGASETETRGWHKYLIAVLLVAAAVVAVLLYVR
jgi:putative methionine-R-sulfoxide reductase with GAF domain